MSAEAGPWLSAQERLRWSSIAEALGGRIRKAQPPRPAPPPPGQPLGHTPTWGPVSPWAEPRCLVRGDVMHRRAQWLAALWSPGRWTGLGWTLLFLRCLCCIERAGATLVHDALYTPGGLTGPTFLHTSTGGVLARDPRPEAVRTPTSLL